MKLLEMSLEDILLDTLEYYGKDLKRYCMTQPFGNNCKYSPITLGIEEFSEGCAIGRLLGAEVALKLDNYGIGAVTEIIKIKPSFINEKVEEVLKTNLSFFEDLQQFHDLKGIVDNKLSLYGKWLVNKLITKYNFDQSKFTKWL